MIKTHSLVTSLCGNIDKPPQITDNFWFTFWISAMITLLNFHTDECAGNKVTFSVQLWAFFPPGVCVLPLCPAASDSGGQSSSLGKLLIWKFPSCCHREVLSNLPSSCGLTQLLWCQCDLWLFCLGLLHWDYLSFASFITCTNIVFQAYLAEILTLPLIISAFRVKLVKQGQGFSQTFGS